MAQGLKGLVVAEDLIHSQNPQGASQPLRTLVPGDPMPSPDLHRHQACTRCTDKHAKKAKGARGSFKAQMTLGDQILTFMVLNTQQENIIND